MRSRSQWSVSVAKVTTTMSPACWAYCLLRGQFGQVVEADGEGAFVVRLATRQGIAADAPTVNVPASFRHDWCRIRKPVLPIPLACRDIDDWLIRDFDFGPSQPNVDALYKLTRLWDLDEFSAFYQSQGMDGGVSVALREQMLAVRCPAGSSHMTRLALLALPLEQFLSVTVRPRGVDSRHSLAPYPLSEAMEDWAIQHEHAVEIVRVGEMSADACERQLPPERSRG